MKNKILAGAITLAQCASTILAEQEEKQEDVSYKDIAVLAFAFSAVSLFLYSREKDKAEALKYKESLDDGVKLPEVVQKEKPQPSSYKKSARESGDILANACRVM